MNQRGDTIVEVLIAIAVVAAVLGGAFAATSRSLRGARQSQERGEAVKLVEGQLESLQAALKDDAKANQIFGLVGFFCITPAMAVQTNVNHTDCREGPGDRYSLSIRGIDLPSTGEGKEFTATAVWDKIGGGPQERVEIVYRVYRR